MKYGRSLSFCVKDILSGKINKNDVGVIVTSTSFKNPEMWQKGIESYQNSYWYDYTLEECTNLINWLIDNNKIEQPRLTNGKVQALYKFSKWADTYQEAIASLEYM